MRNLLCLCCGAIMLTACNSVYMKPNTLDTSKVFYADRGGYSMRRSVKEAMESRGYNVIVGKAKTSKEWTDAEGDSELDTTNIPNNTKYVIKAKERREVFRPFWCALNGFWWWNFNVSIADQETGEELLTWRGRGCANSSIRLLNRILDDMEK